MKDIGTILALIVGFGIAVTGYYYYDVPIVVFLIGVSCGIWLGRLSCKKT